MKFAYVALLMIMLAGCATKNADEQTVSEKARNIAISHTELSAAYFGRLQYATALQEIGVALRADPTYSPAYNVSGLIRMALHEDELAESDFLHSIKLDKTSPESRNNYGWFLCQRGRAKESVPQFLEALKNPLYQTPEVAYSNAGVCAFKAGDVAQAESYLQRALILQPGMSMALYGFAELHFSKGNFAHAKSYFIRFQQNVQDLNAEQLWLAIRIERKMHDANSEASYILQLGKRFPDSPEFQLSQMGE
ncbi:MAG: type IV pilus biogenesis/stability protein PilW [Sideroxydans sp.]|nr:type IV pilus biogenesis/stability protein PilW [Sideroxydans sp.]